MPRKTTKVDLLSNKDPLDPQNLGPDYTRLLATLQGNILEEHGRDYAAHVFVSFQTGATQARQWVAKFSKSVISAAAQLKLGNTGRFANFLLTSHGYRSLGFEARQIPQDFRFFRGMKAPASKAALSDDHNEWEPQYRNTDIDAMILLAVNDRKVVESWASAIEADLKRNQIARTFTELGIVMRNQAGMAIEHFGYVDGISDPCFFTTQLQQQGSITNWDPFAPLNLVLVQEPKASPGDPDTYGSYLVYRKLEQHVPAFEQARRDLARKLVGGATPRNIELAGAFAVGRFTDGTPVTLHDQAGRGRPRENDFTYDQDFGRKCPFHAHVRNANLRVEPERGSVNNPGSYRSRRIVRRGIPYGVDKRTRDAAGNLIADDRTPSEGIGLLFMCFQSDIGNQFEYIQKSLYATNIGLGIDSITGHTRVFTQAQEWPDQWNGSDRVTSSFAKVVKVKGGEYFFAPSISFLKNIGGAT